MGRMEKEAFVFLLLLLLLTFQTCSAASNTQQPKRRESLSVSSSSSSNGPGSSVFPIFGNVYPDGLYYVSVSIGNPPKKYFLDIDTGSDLTWVQCDAPCVSCYNGPHPPYKPARNKLVFCKDPLCAASPSLIPYTCEEPRDQCDYQITYADGSFSDGVLVRDTFSLRMSSGSLAQPSLTFGCGYNQGGSSSTSTLMTDGVLGLGNGKSSILSQLRGLNLVRNVTGHCISGQGGGYLFFGDSIIPSSGVTWTPMSRNRFHKYSPGPMNIIFGKQPIGVKDLLVVFDSGSTYTYFASQPYQAFVSMLKKSLSGKPLKEVSEDEILSLCWEGSRRFKSILEVREYFKPLILIFANGKKATLEIPLEGYLIISGRGNVCLGILNGSEGGLQDLNIIGDISLQDLMVIYDNEKQKIGWVRENCNRLPTSGTALF
ncbi:aspartic proteinase Asp1-like isoform X1 [Magnolia sinica]|uniref:aspartic proteinase Asp1-like isoform X1 n=1 Tax=Magnolia sinica TaxID=86752 RepID=UPI00265A3FD0|nr:aspartic proteinase Asp1-like isoform X1 [Magnolia sinica]